MEVEPKQTTITKLVGTIVEIFEQSGKAVLAGAVFILLVIALYFFIRFELITHESYVQQVPVCPVANAHTVTPSETDPADTKQ